MGIDTHRGVVRVINSVLTNLAERKEKKNLNFCKPNVFVVSAVMQPDSITMLCKAGFTATAARWLHETDGCISYTHHLPERLLLRSAPW